MFCALPHRIHHYQKIETDLIAGECRVNSQDIDLIECIVAVVVGVASRVAIRGPTDEVAAGSHRRIVYDEVRAELQENVAQGRDGNGRSEGHIYGVGNITDQGVSAADSDASGEVEGDCSRGHCDQGREQVKPHLYNKVRLYHLMNNSKNQAYQQKILQLLLREKAVEAVNQTLTRENSTLKDRLAATRRQHEEQLQELRGKLESNIAKAEMEIRLAKRGRNSQQEKRVELQNKMAEIAQSLSQTSLQKQRLEEKNRQIQKQLNQSNEELAQKIFSLQVLEQKYRKQEEVLRRISEQNANNQSQIQQLSKQRSNLIKGTSKIQADLNEVKQHYEEALQKIESFKSEVAAKTKLKLQKEGENSKYEMMLQQLSKENGILRDRKKKLEDDVKALQQQKEQSQDAYKRVQKLNKKNRQVIADNEAKIKELQDECATVGERSRNLDRALKSAKREIQQLQQNLQNADEAKNSESSRYKKYETLSKAQKSELLEKQQKLQELQQASIQLKKQIQAGQRSILQLSVQVQRLSKENKYLSQQSQQQQEKRILSESEKEKAISMIIRDKDVLSRANFKLLQLLEFKDQAIKAILESIDNKTDRIQVLPVLDGDELLKQIRSGDRDKLRNAKERILLLEQWIKSKR